MIQEQKQEQSRQKHSEKRREAATVRVVLHYPVASVPKEVFDLR